MNNSSKTIFNLSLNPEIKQQLQTVAKLTHKTEQELILEALEKHLKELSKPQNCYDLAIQLGVIGVAEELPPDLSTNSDYLQGFGQL
ncbi:hypothetical protein [Cyanothece sp. BG0011]|uniref:hypothetical protein n=1 Tax=Cyanothece sp. BG0011 TaxID=2082950 RepID=UPI000D1ECBFB|nr:hypothetical protein [Cyanothece sp. BG0011]